MATIRDVAQRAGVSISTVSRVLNNTCAVAEDKAARVRLAADELGYVPNPAARSLLKRETGGIGILLPYVSGEFFSDFLTGMDDTAKRNDCFLLISTSHHKAAEWRASVQSVYKRVDGLVVMAPQMSPEKLKLGNRIPIVFVNSPGPDTDAGYILNFDNFGGTYQAARHLVDLGHRQFAFLRGPQAAHDAAVRLEGFEKAMNEAGIEDYTVIQAGYDQEQGHSAGSLIASMDPRPTAVVASNDYCALGAMSAMMDAGLRVPEDVSVVGFDDVASARFSSPQLTTISVPIREIGVKAVQYLLKHIRDNDPVLPRRETLPVSLVVRGSTAPPN